MSVDTAAMIAEMVTLVESVSDVENVYSRRVAYADTKDFVAKYQNAAKDGFLGFNIYLSQRVPEITAMNAQITHWITFTTTGIIGVVENDPDFSYDVLETMLDAIQQLYLINLTLSGTVTNAEMPTRGLIDFTPKVGKLFWEGSVTWMIQKQEIINNIS